MTPKGSSYAITAELTYIVERYKFLRVTITLSGGRGARIDTYQFVLIIIIDTTYVARPYNPLHLLNAKHDSVVVCCGILI